MNFTRIFWSLWVFVTCLSSAPQSQGQTLDEQPMGTGTEPVVNCDRDLNTQHSERRIELVWMGSREVTTTIYWKISHDFGASWAATVPFMSGAEQRIDPFAACDIWSSDNPRRMYFGWFTQISGDTPPSPTGDYFLRSQRGDTAGDVDNFARITSPGADRPWLAANTASLYLSFHTGAQGYVKRATIPPGTDPVVWPGSEGEVSVFSPDNNTTLTPNFQVAAHRDSAGSERVFLMARQYVTSGCSGGGVRDNSIRIRRSLNQGVDWQDNVTINVDGVDGFVAERDSRMTAEHISRDPRTSVNIAYAFYVRNEAAPYPGGGGKRSVLYSRGQR